jgi:hypothetical protein
MDLVQLGLTGRGHADNSIQIRKEYPPERALQNRMITFVRTQIMSGPKDLNTPESRHLKLNPKLHKAENDCQTASRIEQK